MKTNMNKLRGKIAEKGMTQEQLATRIGIDASTFSRKMSKNGLSFTVEEVQKIVALLEINSADAQEIFLH